MTLRQKIETTTSVLIALCALAVTLSVVRAQFFPPSLPAELVPVSREPSWQKYATSDMRIGPPTARVTITEFSDFQCPACYRLYRALAGVRAQRGNNVKIIFRNYPLDALHPYARPAALAAECAADQGQFAALHDYLFDHQESLDHVKWALLARRLGVLDTSAFTACLSAPGTVARLRRDSADAVKLGIPGTPLVLVNEWVYRGAPSEEELDSVITRELAAPKR